MTDPDPQPADSTDDESAAGDGSTGDDTDDADSTTNGEAADDFYRDSDDAEFSLDLTTPRDGGPSSDADGDSTNGVSGPFSEEAASKTNGEASTGDPDTNGQASTGTSTNGQTSTSASTNGQATNGRTADDERDADLLTDAADVDGESDDDEVEPVELLVQLAEEGEIDPWDIDIVAVTDAFLDRLDESDLRTSGRALFYASVLLRMKSDAILTPDEPADEEPWAGAMGEEPFDHGHDPIDALESEIDRRLDRKHARGSPETLDELVRELREAEYGSWWKEGRTYDTSDSPHGYNRGTQTLDYHAADDFRDEGEPDEAAVTGTAHMEDIEATIADVERALRSHYDKGRDEVLFAEIRSEGGRPVQTFLALLFLAHRGVVHLQQDDLFGDLWIQNPAVAAVGDEAVAD
jgi:segregation and condensation protein A